MFLQVWAFLFSKILDLDESELSKKIVTKVRKSEHGHKKITLEDLSDQKRAEEHIHKYSL